MDNIETKYIGGLINTKAIKVVQRNGVPVGVFESYIATFDIDEPDFFGERDRFKKGAFLESLAQHRDRDNRQIRLKDMHGRVVGGFPSETAKEDDIGLFAIGEINLDVQQGAEMFALMRQGVLVDMSIGFKVVESETDNDLKLRTIEKAEIFEGSVVEEPRNRKAKIVSLKKFDLDEASKCLQDDCQLDQNDIDQILISLKGMMEEKRVTPFLDLPIAGKDRVWDSRAAISRVRDLTDSQDEPSARYRRAFLWFDADKADNFGAYKFPYADVIDGTLTAIPRAINNAKARLGQSDIPDADKPRVLRNIERYQDKADDEEDKFIVELIEVQGLQSLKEIEVVLKKAGFSSNAANAVISKIAELKSSDQGDLGKGTGDDGQGDLGDEGAVLTQLKDMAKRVGERSVLRKINQLQDKVNSHVEGSPGSCRTT